MRNGRGRLLVSLLLFVLLVSCGSPRIEEDVESQESPKAQTEDIKSSLSMTQAQWDNAMKDLDVFVYGVLGFSGNLAVFIQENPEILNQKRINLMDFPQYTVMKDNLGQIVQDIRAYDTSGLSIEFKACFEEVLAYALEMESYALDLSKDLEMEELSNLIFAGLLDSQNKHIEEIGELLVAAGTAFDEVKAANKSSDSSSNSTNFCTYKDVNGKVCGKATNKYDGLCDKHFEELYETYKSLGGTGVPIK